METWIRRDKNNERAIIYSEYFATIMRYVSFEKALRRRGDENIKATKRLLKATRRHRDKIILPVSKETLETRSGIESL